MDICLVKCSTAFCGLMKEVLSHLKTCNARQSCPQPHCLSSRQLFSHWKTCSQTDCPVCSSLRRVFPAYLDAVVQNPKWRAMIMARFQWLFAFLGLANLTMPTTPPRSTSGSLQPHRSEEVEHGATKVKNSEE